MGPPPPPAFCFNPHLRLINPPRLAFQVCRFAGLQVCRSKKLFLKNQCKTKEFKVFNWKIDLSVKNYTF